MDGKTPFGDVLKKIRYSKRLSQDEFAKILGTSKQVISRYENNQRVPKITVVEQFANRLNLPISYFVAAGIISGDIIAEKSDMPYMTESIRQLLVESQNLTKEEVQLLISLVKMMKTKN